MKQHSTRAYLNTLQYVIDKYLVRQHDTVWLASYPRSGNTFLRTILKHAYGIPSFDVYQLRDPRRGSASDEDLGLTVGRLPRHPTSGRRVYFLKTHMSRPKDDDSAALYLVRDGRDALVSHAHLHMGPRLPPEQRTKDKFEEMLRYLLDKGSYGGWSGNIEAWTPKPTTRVIRFEDLIRTPIESTHAALTDIGYVLPETQAALPSFEELRARSPESFRKGRVGGWREEMPDDIHRLFWQKHGETMVKLGYTDDMPV